MLGHIELSRQIGGDHSTVRGQALSDQTLTLARKGFGIGRH
jgi:hypothetical protein